MAGIETGVESAGGEAVGGYRLWPRKRSNSGRLNVGGRLEKANRWSISSNKSQRTRGDFLRAKAGASGLFGVYTNDHIDWRKVIGKNGNKIRINVDALRIMRC